MNKLKKILACMIITLGILYLPEIHANASTVTIDEATFPDSCVRKFAQEQDVNKDGVLSDEERYIVDYALWDWYTAAAYGVDGSHLIDFTGMQNFPKITKVRLQLGCKVNGKEIYLNYKASNLFQCFPHVKQLSIVSFGTKSIFISFSIFSEANMGVPHAIEPIRGTVRPLEYGRGISPGMESKSILP